MRYTDKELWKNVPVGSRPLRHIADETPVYYQNWPSVLDLLEEPFKNPRNKDMFERYIRGSGRRNWWGIDGGYAAVENVIKHGWKEGLEKARSNLDKVDIPKFQSIRRRKRRKDYGDEIDMQAVYSGNLDTAWTQTHRQVSPARTPRKVTIIADSSLSCNVQPEQVFWTGAVALRINDALQEAGRSVQLVSSSTNYMNDKNYVLSSSVVLKDYAEPLEPEVVATTMCLSGFMRGPMFLSFSVFERTHSDHYGYPVHNFKPKNFRESSDSVFVISDIYSKQDAERKIRELVSEIGS